MAVPTSMMVVGGDENFSAFIEQMAAHGFIEGQTIAYERYVAPAATAVDIANTIVNSKPDAIFFGGSISAALAARQINKTIPVVAYNADVVGQGLVDNPAHPEGNITGVSGSGSPDVYGKILDLLCETVPPARTIAYLTGGSGGKIAVNEQDYEVARQVASRRGVTLVPILVEEPGSEALLSQAFRAVAAARADGVQLGHDSTMRVRGPLAAMLAIAAKMPTISPYDTFATSGGLLSYGPSGPLQARKAADYMALILGGAKPSDLPVVQATIIDFIVNLKTAQAIGITIPPSVLAQATRLIE
jgi:putative ABC transport system substrate-binding protein